MLGAKNHMSDKYLPPKLHDYFIVRAAAEYIEGSVSELLHSLADDMETLSKMENKPDFKFRFAAIKLSNDILKEE
jgi:hypothetical protein